MRRLLAGAALAALAVTGCSGLSERECRAGDWRERGEADGTAGRAPRLAGYRSDCGPHGTPPDASEYRAGYEAGLARYCVPSGAYQAGRRGEDYRGACGARADPAFHEAHRHGLEMAMYRQRLRDLRQDLDQMRLLGLDDVSRRALPEDWARFRVADGERRLAWLKNEAAAFDRRHARRYGASELDRFELDR